MKYSIIIAIYRVEKYLIKCLNSVKTQLGDDVEAILVDDGSDDNCPAICDQYVAEDNRFSVIHQNNMGLVSARRTGIRAAKGTYILCIDGDDWLEDNAISVLDNVVTNINPDIIIFDYFEGNEDRKTEVHQCMPSGTYQGESHALLCSKMLYNTDDKRLWDVRPNIWCKLFKKSKIQDKQNKIPDSISFGEDAACVYSSLIDSSNVVVIHECLYNYRINYSSMVRAYDDNLLLKTINLIEYMESDSSISRISNQLHYYEVILLQNLIKNELRGNVDKESLASFLDECLCQEVFIEALKCTCLKNFDINHLIMATLFKLGNSFLISRICNIKTIKRRLLR
ncbi:MAG: glycosyltransferase family 2 protein [Ruminiclostridium sp.]